MNFIQMRSRCPGSELVSVAYLIDWIYFINGDGYAGIEEKKHAVTHGCLWRLNKDHWQSLDHYEAVSAGYYSRVQMIVTRGKELIEQETEVYLSNNRSYGIPAPSYHLGVLQGATRLGLPEDHIKFLKSWEFGNPNNEKTGLSNE